MAFEKLGCFNGISQHLGNNETPNCQINPNEQVGDQFLSFNNLTAAQRLSLNFNSNTSLTSDERKFRVKSSATQFGDSFGRVSVQQRFEYPTGSSRGETGGNMNSYLKPTELNNPPSYSSVPESSSSSQPGKAHEQVMVDYQRLLMQAKM